MSTLYENCITGDDTFFSLKEPERMLAQTFTPVTAHTITEVKVRVDRSGSPGTVTVAIRSTSGGEPTDTVLTSGTFDGDIVGEGSGNQEWVTVSLTPYALEASVEYAIVMDAPSSSGTFQAIHWWIDNSGTGYARGNTEWSTDSGANWDNQSDAYDAMFEDRGNPLGIPTVTTQECTDVIAQSATGHGTVTDLGDSAVTQHGHCWATTTDPTTSDSKTTNGAKPNLGQFTSAITGLTPGTKYYVRAYVTNTEGTAYGDNVEIAGNVTTIGRRHIWIEGKELHYFDNYGDERKIEGVPDTSGLPWWWYL